MQKDKYGIGYRDECRNACRNRYRIGCRDGCRISPGMFRRIRHMAASAPAEKRREPARQRIRRRTQIPLRSHGTEPSEKAAEAAGSTSDATPPAAGADAYIPAE